MNEQTTADYGEEIMNVDHNLQKVLVVTGDVTMDWNLLQTEGAGTGGSARSGAGCTRACWQRGGAALLADLIQTLADTLCQGAPTHYTIRQTAAPREAVPPEDRQYPHRYTLWSPFPRGAKPPLEQERVWRIQEFLGMDRCAASPPVGAVDWRRIVDDDVSAQLIVLDEVNLGFRDQYDLWPAAITTEGRQPWVVLKMARPVAEGALWEHLHQHHAERMIVVMTIEDLRLTEVQISRELSWERTAQDLAWELIYNPRVNALSHCAQVVVSFGAAGAVLFSRAGGKSAEGRAARRQLIFDPKVIEGMWEQEHPGSMMGHTACLTASIARQCILSPGQPNLHLAIQRGIAAMRTLYVNGYGKQTHEAQSARLAFPIDTIAKELAKEELLFADVEVPDPSHSPTAVGDKISVSRFWSILESRYEDNLDLVAQQIIREGAETALQGVPLGQFGHLLTVDRQEIESFRSIRTLVGEYGRHGRQNKPLSIAVFGPPGSGKSFGITEVASSLLPGQIKVLEFNLSQFTGPEELLHAFHQVHDVGLSGLIPLVFWDEFDTALAGSALGWLRYFLAPMQDGKFQHGQLSHPLGRSIFVFAGSTSARMEAFGQGLEPEEFRTAKGTDFLSRLKGYVNILGPNPQATVSKEGEADPYCIIRRAILLRSIFQRNAPHLFERTEGKQRLHIDSGVLRAFLETRKYKHGVRSMEAIIAMSALTGQSYFERSCLPIESQLDLHVDGKEFLALVQRLELEGRLLETLAESLHWDVFCAPLREQGYQYGVETNEALKTHSSLKPYAELPENEKEDNRSFVRDIPNRLAQLGCVMIPARSNEPAFEMPAAELERMAEIEHDRWINAKLGAGWRWGPETDKARRLHKDLVPWRKLSEEERVARYTGPGAKACGEEELPEPEKEKDRRLVRGIPNILAKAGYAIAKIGDDAAKVS